MSKHIDFIMQQPQKGSTVFWYEGGVRNDERACPAIVLISHPLSVRLKVFGLESDFRLECVRHMEDPNLKDSEKISDGAWDFTPFDRAKAEPKAKG